MQPIIKVIATDLEEDQAYLVEKALIWRLGKRLTNISSGKFSENFRPANSLHLHLSGFDTRNGIYFANVGHWADHRHWNDARKYGFLAAGNGRTYSDQLSRLSIGDLIAAYLTGSGYVGIGRVVGAPVPVSDFRFRGKRLAERMLEGKGLLHDWTDEDRCEYLVKARWIKSVPRKEAKFRRRAGLFSTQQIVASLANQPKTLRFLEREFGVCFEKLLNSV